MIQKRNSKQGTKSTCVTNNTMIQARVLSSDGLSAIISDVRTYKSQQHFDDEKIAVEHYDDGAWHVLIPTTQLVKDDINEGDTVIVEVLHPGNQRSYNKCIIGELTRKWNDEPYCTIDNDPVQLASEGHSTVVWKLIDVPIPQ